MPVNDRIVSGKLCCLAFDSRGHTCTAAENRSFSLVRNLAEDTKTTEISVRTESMNILGAAQCRYPVEYLVHVSAEEFGDIYKQKAGGYRPVFYGI